MARVSIPLNFDWKYCESYTQEAMKREFDDSEFVVVNIPHANKEIPFNNFDEKMYQFVSAYRKHFEFDKAANEGKRVLLHFEGVANYAEVYLNDVRLGEHKCGYTAFTFDITEALVQGENVLSVMVDSTERKDIPPFGNVVDYLCYGGIYREVWLEVVEDTYIADAFIRTKNILLTNKYIDVDVTLNKAAQGTLTAELIDGEKVLKKQSCAFDGTVLNFKWKTPDVTLWTIENPKLYTLRLSFGEDVKEYRFGFRKCEFRKDGFFLNGKHIKIRGLNRHQAYPYVGYAMPASAQIADADFLKYELGVNLVRTSHYPDSVHFLNRCDEIGLLVFTEIPSWQYTGEGEWRENFLQNVKDMVLRDRNHPSVILWGVRVNEGPDCDELYTQSNAIAHALDDTRQTGGVRNMPRSHLLEDVYTYNDFVHSGGKTALLPPSAVAGNAPYLVTEHNGHMYPTKSYDKEDVRVEHTFRHARVLNKAYGSDRYSGAIGWCMSDYNTHKDFGSGDKICYHGVSDMFRVPKLAGMLYASQQDEKPVLEITSSMDIGEHPGGMLGQIYALTNCDYIKVYKNGEYMSTMTPERSPFKNLPHPPIPLDDFIGEALTEKENINELSASFLKPTLVAAAKDGWSVSPKYFVTLAAGFLTSGKTINDMVDLFTKYIGNWGDSQISYRFEGYINDECVKTVTKTAITSLSLQVSADSTELVENETYDVTRIVLKAVDQNGNRMPFANNGITVRTTGPIEVIGPGTFSLLGGDRAFWIKTTGKSGKGIVKISAESMGEYFIDVKVKKV
ncbi:MAG: glycoside hydrolase family 2 protein [Ruminococcaceae bacterium]|nr:glycoside hydrolase family 2 protein [Oscillospiraceae bacterium]MBQ6872850.1 beta galactosidase jelly roll domain-containing protein [Clostridia bacterium]